MENAHDQWPSIQYLDLDLQIENGSEDKYPIVLRSRELGEAHASMHFPFDPPTLEHYLAALENKLLSSGGRDLTALQDNQPNSGEFSSHGLLLEEQSIQMFCQVLFDSLFIDDVRDLYLLSLNLAKQQTKGLRLKLHIQPPYLASLPWELMYDKKQ